jgi:hypothetical protein
MKSLRSLRLVLGFSAVVFSAGFALAAGTHHAAKIVTAADGAQLVPVTDQTDAKWLAKARAEYPLKSCVVSEDDLDEADMGGPKEFVYKRAGQPDRLVRFCCGDCVKDFSKEPAKYLKAIDDAAAKKTK